MKALSATKNTTTPRSTTATSAAPIRKWNSDWPISGNSGAKTPTEFRFHLRAPRHLVRHGTALPARDDLRNSGGLLPQPHAVRRPRGNSRQPDIRYRRQQRAGAIHRTPARRRESLRKLHRPVRREVRQPPLQLGTLILQILSGGQYERGRAQDLQNPVSPQKCRHPGTRRRGQYRLGKLCAAFGPRKNGQRSQCKLDSPPGDRSRQPIDGRLAVVPAAGEDDRRFYADQIRLLEDDRFPGQPRGNLFRRKVRHADPQTGSGYVSQRDPLGRCHFGQAGRMGLAASLHPHPKGKGHLSNGRFDPAGPPL